jgi:nicotinate-nucleotide adenylyltransferase
MRVALLGGSFNPPHIGHLMAALYVRACLADDEVWLMPTFHHPFGKATAPYEHRVAMCELAARELGPWLKVSRAEAEVKGEGRTIELLEHLLPRNPGTQFRLVIGSDIIADLPQWRAWDRIKELVTVTVLYRAGYPAAGTVGPPLAEVSSTEIRQRLGAGEEPGELVPRAVLDCRASWCPAPCSTTRGCTGCSDEREAAGLRDGGRALRVAQPRAGGGEGQRRPERGDVRVVRGGLKTAGGQKCSASWAKAQMPIMLL